MQLSKYQPVAFSITISSLSIMIGTFSLLVLLIAGFTSIHAEPFLFFPTAMLPRTEMTFNFTFNGFLNTAHVQGVYTLQPVFDRRTETIIGYRNWQSYTGDFQALFYGVSYLNSTYLQALIDPESKNCVNVFAETMNCTEWLSTASDQWESNCTLIRDDTPITGEMTNLVRVSPVDRSRPLNYLGTAHVTGTSDTTLISYEFVSRTEQESFPEVNCYF